MNLYEVTYDLLRQLPRGKVSTYGALAKALGDIRASRAVGQMLHVNPYDDAPCYRVVYSDGRIGGYATGVAKKIRMLKNDGIEIIDGKIDLKKYLFDAFATDYPLKRLREEQETLRVKVSLDDDFARSTVAGVDVSYGKYAYGAYVEFDFDGVVLRKKTVKIPIEFPYIPTYLAYAELPVINELLRGEHPGIVMVDGNGILHPRRFGLACHVGVVHDVATIGIAKKKLCGTEEGDSVLLDGKVVAKRLGKLFISPGHRVSVDTALSITRNFMQYSVPEPTRQAHILANEARRSREGIARKK